MRPRKGLVFSSLDLVGLTFGGLHEASRSGGNYGARELGARMVSRVFKQRTALISKLLLVVVVGRGGWTVKEQP